MKKIIFLLLLMFSSYSYSAEVWDCHANSGSDLIVYGAKPNPVIGEPVNLCHPICASKNSEFPTALATATGISCYRNTNSQSGSLGKVFIRLYHPTDCPDAVDGYPQVISGGICTDPVIPDCDYGETYVEDIRSCQDLGDSCVPPKHAHRTSLNEPVAITICLDPHGPHGPTSPPPDDPPPDDPPPDDPPPDDPPPDDPPPDDPPPDDPPPDDPPPDDPPPDDPPPDGGDGGDTGGGGTGGGGGGGDDPPIDPPDDPPPDDPPPDDPPPDDPPPDDPPPDDPPPDDPPPDDPPPDDPPPDDPPPDDPPPDDPPPDDPPPDDPPPDDPPPDDPPPDDPPPDDPPPDDPGDDECDPTVEQCDGEGDPGDDECDPSVEECDGEGEGECDPLVEECDDENEEPCDPLIEQCDGEGPGGECDPSMEECGPVECDPETESCDCNPEEEECCEDPEGCLPFSGAPAETLYEPYGKTYTDVIMEFSDSIHETTIMTSIEGALDVSPGSGSCPSESVSIIGTTITFDFLCTSVAQTLFNLMGAVLLVIYSYAAFRIAIY